MTFINTKEKKFCYDNLLVKKFYLAVNKMTEPVVEVVIEPQTKKKGRPKKPVQYNEKGERLTKKGTVDKRKESSLKNLEKSQVYQDLMKAKKAREEKVKAELNNIPDTESEPDEEPEPEPEEADEWEIEEYVVKEKGKPQVIEVEKIVEKEVVTPDPRERERIRQLEHANKQLARNIGIKENIAKLQFMRNTIKLK